MAYSVLTQSDLLDKAEEGEKPADRLAVALTAMEEQGLVLIAVDRPHSGEAQYIFHVGEHDRRLNNIR